MISRDTLIRLIKDFNENPYPSDLKERSLGIPLEIPLRRAISIIGPRRSGKTYMMFLLIRRLIEKGVKPNRILYVNFESYNLIGAKLSDAKRLVDVYFEIYPENRNRKVWFFLDEIQNLEDWETFVRSLIDKGGISIYISGSSSKLLSREIATQLRGRTISYEIYPLSFNEFLDFKEIKFDKFLSSRDRSRIINALNEYLEWGGYPETLLFDKEKILREILEVTIQRDLIERYKIRNEKILKILIRALAYSKEFSVHKFYNFLKSSGYRISKNTLYNYMEMLSDILVIFPVRKFSSSYKKEERSIPKIYFVDNGLLRIQGVDSRSKLMENLVFMHLLRDFGRNKISYYKTINGQEVDFVIRENSRVKQLIQVCYEIEDFNVKEREVKSLLRASRDLSCNNLLIITYDYEDVERIGNRKIIFKPLWKWLLKIN
ncbi:MAG: ATP-binding protein [archaeon GB-1867-005]|nr:ATP-binding protein [Candidatus Culexmicrobium cathedralense]